MGSGWAGKYLWVGERRGGGEKGGLPPHLSAACLFCSVLFCSSKKTSIWLPPAFWDFFWGLYIASPR